MAAAMLCVACAGPSASPSAPRTTPAGWTTVVCMDGRTVSFAVPPVGETARNPGCAVSAEDQPWSVKVEPRVTRDLAQIRADDVDPRLQNGQPDAVDMVLSNTDAHMFGSGRADTLIYWTGAGGVPTWVVMAQNDGVGLSVSCRKLNRTQCVTLAHQIARSLTISRG